MSATIERTVVSQWQREIRLDYGRHVVFVCIAGRDGERTYVTADLNEQCDTAAAAVKVLQFRAQELFDHQDFADDEALIAAVETWATGWLAERGESL